MSTVWVPYNGIIVPYDFQGPQVPNPDTIPPSPGIEVTPGDSELPVVVLLHGCGGNIFDMTAPAQMPEAPGVNYDYSGPSPADVTIGWSSYPGVGVWSCCDLDTPKPVRSWRDVLVKYGFRTAAYSQFDPDGFLAPPPPNPPSPNPVEELVAVMAALLEHFPEDTQFVLLGHSRGGLLIRKFLKDNPDLARQIRKVITLHTPHTGSTLANAADLVSAAIQWLQNVVGQIAQVALGWLLKLSQENAYQEMAIGSTMLIRLADGETPLPWIEYYTFGGISVRLTRIRSWVYTLDSAVPQFHLPPFLHRRAAVELPAISPVATSLPPTVDELTEGRGDLLTADNRTRLPFAVHQTNPINHAEALWDPTLQAQVLRILGVDVPIPQPPGLVPSFWG